MTIPFGSDTGTANTYVVTTSPAITSLTTGVVALAKIANTNTGASTLNIGGLGAHSIVSEAGNAMTAGQLSAGQTAFFIYDGTSFELLWTFLNGFLVSPNGLPTIPEVPLGNSITALSAAVLNSVTASATAAEFASQINFTCNQGNGNSTAYKEALFVGIEGQVGSGSIWAANFVAQLDSLGTGKNASVIGLEIDINNANANYDTILSTYSSYGLYIAGKGPFRITSAVEINNNGGSPIYNYGISFTNNSIQTNTFLDQTSSTNSIEIAGTHAIGIDLTKASVTYCLTAPNSSSLAWSNFAKTALLNGLLLDSSNNFELGYASNAILCGAITKPSVDNTYTCGASGARWSAVWAANGTIQTSDPSLKTDIAPLPSVLNVVNRLEPKTFRWIVGGTDVVDTDEERLVQETRIVQYEEQSAVLRDGRYVLVKKMRERSEGIFDDMPVHDENGDPLLDEEGRQRTHPVPRMIKKNVPIQKMITHPGKRTHWGFLAPDVKAAFDDLDMDFGGYIKAEDGSQHLRPDQLVPVLWKAVQELSTQVNEIRENLNSSSPYERTMTMTNGALNT